MNELSANSLANASALSNIDGLTLQMVNIRIMNSDQKTVRYLYGSLFSLSDGSNTIRALTSMPFVEKIESGEIRKNTIVHIISSRKVRDSAFYVTDMTVVKQMDYVIGNPLGGSVNQQAQQQQPSAYQQPAARPPVQQQAPAYQQPQASYQQPPPSYQQPQASYQQPQPSYPPYQQQSSYQQNPPNTNMPLKNGPVGGNYQVDTTRFNQIPISAIHPYLDKNWYIRCRVTSKSSVRSFNSQRGEGKLFNADLLDSEGSEIRIAFFSECVDLFYEYLQQGKVYDFCNMKVSFANRRYNPLKNEYELAANRFSQI
ncbi:hypothetical protein JH06_2272 [Blastocystis sp. subtype 4]|uniref:hypothetical protein n=1 Tax=Blastocystis sp. subtype 4 TaxID=944170 RepID=UPI000711F468|nr:hypothetical protein JH06_2272 [Blastocystis sp. subtype 4]KNB43826.1 hypothetical protein JH06_2272 [Blastocystis sp. subtype 4]|eukprot:XP_014527269.1 hypothetical protein JH06_2272 [Blastocystis sp. subtype 4]